MDLQIARRNLRLINWFSAFRGSLIMIPVIVPFFQSNGMNVAQITLLQAIFSIAMVVCEIPSGYLADRFGYRSLLLAGAITNVLGFAVYSFAEGFGPLAVAEIILGVGFALISGSDSSLVFDTLKAHPKLGSYRRFAARNSRFALIGEMIAAMLGGLIALVSLRATVFAQVLVYLPLIPMALALTEPPREQRKTEGSFKGIWHAFKKSAKDAWKIVKYALHEHKEVKWLIICGALLANITYPMVWLSQPYYQLLNIPLSLFGVLWAAQYAMTAAFTLVAERYERLGRRFVIASLVVIGVASYLLLGLVPAYMTLAALIGFYFIRALTKPILEEYVHNLIESDVRATVMSVNNQISRLFGVGVTVSLGVVTEAVSLQAALLIAGGFFAICGLATFVAMHRAKLLG